MEDILYVKFTNGRLVRYLDAIETEEYYNGSNRRTLTFTCDTSAIGIDDLNTILSNQENTKSLELINETLGVSNIYDDYVLKLELGVKNVMITPETPDAPAEYVDRLIFKLGRKTYIEESLDKLGITV